MHLKNALLKDNHFNDSIKNLASEIFNENANSKYKH